MPKGVDEQLEAAIRNCLSLRDHDDIPAHVIEMLLRVKRHHDRIGGGPFPPSAVAIVLELAELFKTELSVELPEPAKLPMLEETVVNG